MKLKINDVIRIYGWPMLDRLQDGRSYRVCKITWYYQDPVYHLCPARGYRIVARHLAKNIDHWLSTLDCQDLNKIVLVKEKTLCTPCSK